MAFLRSILFYPLFYTISAIITLLSVLALPFGAKALRRVVGWWGFWHRGCMRYILGIRIEVDGEIPNGPVLVAIKHESFFEAIDMPHLFDFPSVFAKQELFQIPGWGLSARTYGLIPVARDKGAQALRAMIAEAKERLAEGRPLVIFPEGTRAEHGDTPPLRSGFAGLYKLLGLPVVPIAVNSGPFYQGFPKRPGTITYKVGEIIPAGLPRAEAEARVHAAINALNTQASTSPSAQPA